MNMALVCQQQAENLNGELVTEYAGNSLNGVILPQENSRVNCHTTWKICACYVFLTVTGVQRTSGHFMDGILDFPFISIVLLD